MFSPCRQGEAVTIEVCFLCSVAMHTKEKLQECALHTVHTEQRKHTAHKGEAEKIWYTVCTQGEAASTN